MDEKNNFEACVKSIQWDISGNLCKKINNKKKDSTVNAF